MTKGTRAALRVVGFAVASLALLASLLLASMFLWLQTAPGRGLLARSLARQASARLALELSVGRISGSILWGIRLEKVALHDAQGRLVARADALSARYRLRRLIRLHEVDEIAIERPVVVRLPSRVGSHAPPSHGQPPPFSVRNLTIRDGSFRWRGHELHHLSANAAIEQGQQGARGLRVEGELQLVLDENPLSVRAKAELDDARLQVSAALYGAGFAARGSGEWANHRLSASLDALDVASRLISSTRPWAGRGPLHAHGTVNGPLDALQLKLQGHTGNRGVALGARVDVPRRTVRLTARVEAPRRSARLRARAALRGRTLDVTALEARIGATRVSATARVDSDGVDATFEARVAPAEAALIRIQPAAPIQLRVALHGPTRSLDVRIWGELRAAQVALAGRIDLLARRGQVHFVAHDIRVWEIVPRAPLLAFSGAFTFDGALRNQGVEGEMSVTDGSLEISGWRFERLHGAGRVRLAEVGDAQVHSLAGELSGRHRRRMQTQTSVRWDSRGVWCEGSQVVLDGSRATGEVVYTTDLVTRQPLVTVHAQTLSLSPELIQEALHRRPSRAWTGYAQLAFVPGSVDLAFALDTDDGPASGMAQLRRVRGALELPRINLAVGESRFRGAVRVKNGEIVASIEELLLQPQLVYSLLPPLKPILPLRIQGALAGPLHALDLRLLATSGPSAVLLRGRLDLPARRFRLLVALDNFQMARSRSSGRVTLELALLGRLVKDGVAGTLTLRHASGMIYGLPLDAARIDVTLNGPKFNVDQILIGVPGAVLEGKGGGTYRDFRIRYGVVITNALALRKVPKSLRVMIGVTQLTPGRTVVGSLRRRGGGKIELSHHAIPPPFRWLNMLYHVLIGHPLHLSVH